MVGARLIDPDSDFNYSAITFAYDGQCNKEAERLCLEGGPGKVIFTGFNYADGRVNIHYAFVCTGIGEFVLIRMGSVPYETVDAEHFKYERKA